MLLFVTCRSSSYALSGSAPLSFPFFFFNDTATTEIYTLSLHDALPICSCRSPSSGRRSAPAVRNSESALRYRPPRSEEHTSELQSPDHLVCRLLLEKKNQISSITHPFPHLPHSTPPPPHPPPPSCLCLL